MGLAAIRPKSIVDGDCSDAMALSRTKMAQRELATIAIPLTQARQWDHRAVNLPETPATDDLGLVTGTLGTNQPTIQAGDLKAAGATTRYAGFLVPLPLDYEAGQTVTIRVWAGMKTTIATPSCTVDCEAYQCNKDLTVDGDLCTTAPQSINSLSFASYDFTITPTTLSPGDILDVRLAIICNDAATGTAVIPTIAQVELLVDIR